MPNGPRAFIGLPPTLCDGFAASALYNPAKTGTFPVARRIELIQQALGPRPRVRVESFAGRLLVDVCQDLGAGAIVKGLRGGTDFAFELPMALMNRHLTGVETVFLPGNPAYEHVSSSLIKEVHALGGDITGLVPDVVLAALHEALPQRD